MPSQQIWELIQRYISGDCTPNERRMIEQWMSEDQENQKLVNDLKKIWELAPEEIFQVSVEDAWKQFQKRQVKKPIFNVRQYNPYQKRNWHAVMFRAAAVILVVALAGFFFWQFMNDSQSQEKVPIIAMKKVTTQRGETKQITFSDGTTITLNVASTLRFPKEFKGSKREVYLKGEAFFNVAHEKKRPFIVHTSNANVQVLGTQFDVRAWKGDEQTVVGVRMGKVAVIVSDSLNKQASHIFLTNGQATTVKEGQISPIRKINVANLLLWRNGGLYFNNTSFSKVVKQIERQFDVEIRIQKPGLKKVPFTGTFKHAGLNEVLNVVAATMGIHYARMDSVIVFK